MDFEIITKEEFESSGAESADVPPHMDSAPDLTWCEFCKGYYIAEYHFGRKEDECEDLVGLSFSERHAVRQLRLIRRREHPASAHHGIQHDQTESDHGIPRRLRSLSLLIA